jgi:hypothetical protein
MGFKDDNDGTEREGSEGTEEGCSFGASAADVAESLLPHDMGFNEAKFGGVNLLKKGSDCCCGAASASALPHDMGFKDDNDGTEREGSEGTKEVAAELPDDTAAPDRRES